MTSNYLGEEHPSFNFLHNKANEVFNSLNSFELFSFTELFQLQHSGEYYRNNAVFNRIGYNTKLRKEVQKNNEIRGVYVLYDKDEPIYVGISRSILRRLKNHFLGKRHNEASLAYLIARTQYDEEIEVYMGERSKFPFDEYLPEIQKNMIENWKISIIPIENSYLMYFTEFFLACELKTKWNSFETH